jgi:hypothetical protein
MGIGSGTRFVGSVRVWKRKDSLFYGLSIAMAEIQMIPTQPMLHLAVGRSHNCSLPHMSRESLRYVFNNHHGAESSRQPSLISNLKMWRELNCSSSQCRGFQGNLSSPANDS